MSQGSNLRMQISKAVLFERRNELIPKPQGRFLVDFVSRQNPGNGIQALEDTIQSFATARTLATLAPVIELDSIFRDTAIFMAKIEEPAHIFIYPAKETAMRVGGRILRREGWNAVSGCFATWQNIFRSVDPTMKRHLRIETYVDLFEQYWEPNDHPFLEVLDRRGDLNE